MFLGMVVATELMGDTELRVQGVQAFATTELECPEGPGLLLTAGLAGSDLVAATQASFQAAIERALAPGQLELLLPDIVDQFTATHDFATARAQLGGLPGDLVEANVELQLTLREEEVGLSRKEFREGLASLSSDEIRALARDSGLTGARSSLLLVPESPEVPESAEEEPPP